METGLEVCLKRPPDAMRGARLGLLMNQASVDRRYRYSCDLIDHAFPGQLVKLFAPQHGLWCQKQANMIESDDDVYQPLGVPVHSLYCQTRRPTADQLSEIDCLVVDLQDVGTRVYTYIWTLLECLRACAASSVPVVVLDRPNPLGGRQVEGPLLSPHYTSFVGGFPMPMRHGLTIAEIALWLNDVAVCEEGRTANLSVVAMQGWQRSMWFDQTGLPWVAPSPNMPTLATSTVYPGQVLLEGTNLSEGRGTTEPFVVFGAPYLASEPFVRHVCRHTHAGVRLQPIQFCPTFDKWENEICHGVAIRVTDPEAFQSFRLSIAILDAATQLAGESFHWLDPPYEYEYEKPPIDILYGSPRLRERLSVGKPLAASELDQLSDVDSTRWWNEVRSYRLYPA